MYGLEQRAHGEAAGGLIPETRPFAIDARFVGNTMR